MAGHDHLPAAYAGIQGWGYHHYRALPGEILPGDQDLAVDRSAFETRIIRRVVMYP